MSGSGVSGSDRRAGIEPQALAQPGIEWRQWDDECVVYLESEASTHLLDRTASAVFRALSESTRALSFDEIAARAFGSEVHAAAPGNAEDDAEVLRDVLAELERIGAVQLRAS